MILKIRSRKEGENWHYVDHIARMTISNRKGEDFSHFKRRVFTVHDVILISPEVVWEEVDGNKGMSDLATPNAPTKLEVLDMILEEMKDRPEDTSDTEATLRELREEMATSAKKTGSASYMKMDQTGELSKITKERLGNIRDHGDYDPSKDPMAPGYRGPLTDEAFENAPKVLVKPGESWIDARLKMTKGVEEGKKYGQKIKFYEAAVVDTEGKEYTLIFDGTAYLMNDSGRTIDQFEPMLDQ